MPTRIDIALAEGKREINDSIEKASAAKEIDEHDVSPLFRDEAQRQEMSYLDTFLSPEKPYEGDLSLCADENRSPDKSLKSTQNTSGVFNYVLKYEPLERSRIAKLMGPSNYYDTAENNAMIQPKSSHFNQNIGETVGHKQSYTNTCEMDRIQHQNQLPIPIRTIKAQHEKRKFKIPIPSASKRRILNHRLVQKARLKSRQRATNIIKFANRWTRNVKSISHLIRDSISSAVKTVYGLLEDKKNCGFSEDKKYDTIGKHKLQNLSKSQSTSDANVNLPPTKAFMFVPKWSGSKMIMEHAKCFVNNSISDMSMK